MMVDVKFFVLATMASLAAVLAKYPAEVYIALASAVAYVYLSTSAKPRPERLTVTFMSAGLGWSLAADLAKTTWGSEAVAAVVIAAFGYVIMDAARALITDRELVKQWLIRHLKK